MGLLSEKISQVRSQDFQGLGLSALTREGVQGLGF